MLDIIKAHAIKNFCYIAAKRMVPKGIVVHSTGANNPYLRRYVDAADAVGVNQYGNHWNTAKPGGREVCVHAFIGYDKNNEIKVAEILPLNTCCWGVGQGKKGSYNNNPAYIQFEICEDNLADQSYYQKVFSVAAEYCAELCKTYNISIDKIVGHNEAYKLGYGSNHSDPEHWMKKFGESMDDFRNSVAKILNNVTDKNKEISGDKSIEKGDLVSISTNAVYYNGKEIPGWVKSQNWYVASKPIGERVVIDKNEDGTSAICSPIDKKYLTIVKKLNGDTLVNGFEATSNNICNYKVKIVTGFLNIRKGPGTNTAKAGMITDKGVYTIVEERDGVGATKWGKLKSGDGWISLDYVKKI